MADATKTLTPEQVVDAAAQVTADFEKKLAALNAQREQLLQTSVKKAEGTAINKVLVWIQNIFLRLMGSK